MSGCCPLCDLVFNPDAERESVLAAYGEMTRLGPAATEEHLLARAPRCYLCSVRPVSYDGGLCGNCTDALGKLRDTFAAHLRDQRTEADRPGKMKQNCTLTADDPEPPVGSVVRDEVRQVWRRELTGWETTGSSQRYGWSEMVQLNFRSGAVTLLYRGEA